MAGTQQDQQHPLWSSDRQLINGLLEAAAPDDLQLADFARLRVRYNGFPGARDIQADLDKLLAKWQLSEDELFAKTREIHQTQQIYKGRVRGRGGEDWS
jgi:hypothetical protein